MQLIRYQREDGSVPLSDWLKKLPDKMAHVAILRRLDRLAQGNPGLTRPLRGGVCELKIDLGPGYRVYFARHGQTIVLLLCGGSKDTQVVDIAKAITYWEDWKDRSRSTP